MWWYEKEIYHNFVKQISQIIKAIDKSTYEIEQMDDTNELRKQ